jgi:phage tail sheath gpL-like
MTTAFPPSRVASAYGAVVNFKNLAPGGFALAQRIAVIAPGTTAAAGYATTKRQIFSALEAGQTYGFGGPIHSIALQLFPSNGDGVGDIPVTIYPLVDGTTASLGTITPAGSPTAAGTYFVKQNNIVTASFELASGATVADATLAITTAVTNNVNMPTTAVDGTTVVNLTAKWKGLTGDNIVTSVEGPSLGMTFGIVQLTGGATDTPISATQTDQFGDTWETMIIQSNGSVAADLNTLSAFGEGRWAPEVSRPLVSFYSTNETSVATAITIPDARTTDRTNVQLSAPGSDDLPWTTTARMVARIAKVANGASPAKDYLRQQATGLTPGLDSDQWTSAERDTAVKGGSSTSSLRGGVISLEDTITMYHPLGDPTPAYRYVNDIVKLQNMLNDMRIVFDSDEWAGAPLIPNDQATTDRTAKQPKMADAELYKLIDSWGLRALLSDPAAAKLTVVSAIDSGNNRRLNMALTVQLSGNANVRSADLNFGFFFGA